MDCKIILMKPLVINLFITSVTSTSDENTTRTEGWIVVKNINTGIVLLDTITAVVLHY